MNAIIPITVVLLLIFIIISVIYEDNKAKKKFEKDVKELKVGNRYKLKKFRWEDDNPFEVEPAYIVEITDIQFNNKGKIFVQYKQIEPEYKGKPFSDPFSEFIRFYNLIK